MAKPLLLIAIDKIWRALFGRDFNPATDGDSAVDLPKFPEATTTSAGIVKLATSDEVLKAITQPQE